MARDLSPKQVNFSDQSYTDNPVNRCRYRLGRGTSPAASRCHCMAERERYVAVAFLTDSELQRVGNSLRLVIPAEQLPDEFEELLAEIDEADKRAG